MNAPPPDPAAAPLALWEFPLFPEQASSIAERVDRVYLALSAMSLLLVALVFGLMVFYVVRYRAGAKIDRSDRIRKTWGYETTWIMAAVVSWTALFIWAAAVYFDVQHPPADATTYDVVGRQWMWEIQHPDGRREINELHVPVGEPAKLVLGSEDVIHSFYIPAFRVKQDVVPGRYTTIWFTPTKPGEYHLFCAEYCGASHARMVGRVVVMNPRDYEEWLANPPDAPTAQPLEPTGRTSFRELGCDQCHRPETAALAPKLEGLYGREVRLRDGSTVLADEEYIRESIIDPAAKVVDGYQPIMPTYEGMLDEEQLRRLVAAVRALEASGDPDEGDLQEGEEAPQP